jgi:hypothetical protein
MLLYNGISRSLFYASYHSLMFEGHLDQNRFFLTIELRLPCRSIEGFRGADNLGLIAG